MPLSPGLSLARSPSLAEQAADAIVTGIASGVLVPGQRLIEVELAGTLQMSRVPLREALKILEVQGILKSVPHRGTVVPAFDQRRIDRICEARIALERIALTDAVGTFRAEPARLGRLDHIIIAMEDAAARLAWMDVSRADLNFHREICRAADNDIVLTLWEALARHVLIIFGQEIRREHDGAHLGKHHRRLRDMLARGDLAGLQQEIEPHILRLRGDQRGSGDS